MATCAMSLSAARASAAREMRSSAFSRSASRSTLCAAMTDTAIKSPKTLSAKKSCPSACRASAFPARGDEIAGVGKIVKSSLATQCQILGVRIVRTAARRAGEIGRYQLYLQGPRDAPDNLVFRLKEIGARRVELLCPKMRTSCDGDELCVYPYLVATVLLAALQRVTHAEVLADLFYIDRLAFVSEGGAPRAITKAKPLIRARPVVRFSVRTFWQYTAAPGRR